MPTLARLFSKTLAISSFVALGAACMPALASDNLASLFVPIAVTVTPPTGSAPVVTGDFVFTVACGLGSEPRFAFFTPAITLTANALPTPFAPALTGSVGSVNKGNSTPGCIVSQRDEPTPPVGYFWGRRPQDVVIGPINVINDVRAVTAPISLFENTLVAGLPISFEIVPLGGGTVVCDLNPVEPGTASRCNVTPAPGFRLQNAETAVTGCDGTFQGSYYTEALFHPCTITAKFTQYQFVVTAAAAPTFGGEVACTVPANLNATSTCTVTTQPGYSFRRISGCGGASSTSPSFVTAPVAANCNVTAEFSANPIPTLAEWAQRLLALLLAVVAGVFLRRRMT